MPFANVIQYPPELFQAAAPTRPISLSPFSLRTSVADCTPSLSTNGVPSACLRPTPFAGVHPSRHRPSQTMLTPTTAGSSAAATHFRDRLQTFAGPQKGGSEGLRWVPFAGAHPSRYCPSRTMLDSTTTGCPRSPSTSVGGRTARSEDRRGCSPTMRDLPTTAPTKAATHVRCCQSALGRYQSTRPRLPTGCQRRGVYIAGYSGCGSPLSNCPATHSVSALGRCSQGCSCNAAGLAPIRTPIDHPRQRRCETTSGTATAAALCGRGHPVRASLSSFLVSCFQD